MVENLVRRGIAVTLVQLQDQLLSPFDPEMTTPITGHLIERGIPVLLNDSAEAFEADAGGVIVRLKSGRSLAAGMVIIGIGVEPENSLAVAAGLAVGPGGGIQVNDHLQTEDPDIYAVGDAIEVQDFVARRPAQVPLAGPANRQGRIAAENTFGRDARYRGTQGTAIVGVFDRTAAMTGASEKSLRRAGVSYRKIYVHPSHHAGYYPGAEAMTLKVMFAADDGTILGAGGGRCRCRQANRCAGPCHPGRLECLRSRRSRAGVRAEYGSAKDPVNMAGFVAAGLLRGEHPQIDVETILDSRPEDRPFLLDVRTPAEFAGGHIPGAVNIPIDELRSRLAEVSSDREIAAYCQVGQPRLSGNAYPAPGKAKRPQYRRRI